ncbi:MAG TPA: AAA family ATPase [Gemmatimonadales bacterium]
MGDNLRIQPGRVVTDLAELDHDDPVDGSTRSYGPFLDGFDIHGAFDFQEWKDTRATRFASRIARVIARRITDARRHCDLTRMDTLADQLDAIDAYSEEAIRARMEARAMTGDRLGALRVFELWRTRLSEHLGAVPSGVVDRLAERLRRNQWERPVIAGTHQSDGEWPARAFVGRRDEFATCYEIWEEVRRGRPRHLLVRGDTGIGKTTLIDRFVTTVSLEGGTVARVKCYELERELPFGVISGLVNQLLDRPGAGTTAPEHLAELGRLVATVRQRYPSLPEPKRSVGESARILLTEAVAALVTSVADEQPVVLVVDDIHAADATSLAVLHLMLRRMGEIPVLAVLTSSSALHAETVEVGRFIDHAASIRLTQLELGPLPAEDASDLLEALVLRGDVPGPTLRRAVLDGARGNPMALELLMLDWHRRGDKCLALSLGAMVTGVQMPQEDAFRRVVEHTFAALEPETRAVAELGAILGTRLNDVSMYALLDLPAARTMRAMTALTSQRVLRDAGTSLEFTNEYVRGQCYISMAAPLRRMLHGSVADRLLAQDGAEEPIPGLEIAWHLVRAERLVEAVPYLLAGGRESIRRAAAHEADLALSTGLLTLSGQARRTAILLLAEAQQELGRWGEALQVLDIARDPFDESEGCCRDVYMTLAKRWLGRLSPAQLDDATDGLLRIATGSSAIEVRVKALAACLRTLILTRTERQLEQLELVSSEIAPLPMDPFDRLHVSLTRAWILSVRRQNAAALDEIDRGVAVAHGASIASSIAARLLIGKSAILCGLGRYCEALPALDEAASIATRLDNPTLRGECDSQLALVHGRLGDSRKQIDRARLAIRSFPITEWSGWVIGAIFELGLGLADQGRESEAQAAVEKLIDPPVKSIPNWIRQAGLLCAADVLSICGRSRKAFAVARKATSGPLSKILHMSYGGQFARWVAAIALRDGSIDAAVTRIQSNFPNPDALDLKDQVDRLIAVAMLDDASGGDKRSARWKEVSLGMAQLPPGLAGMMRQLGANKQNTSQ